MIDGVDLMVDRSMRDKKITQVGFFGTLPAIPFDYVDGHVQTSSITPRLSIENSLFGVPSQILTGIDSQCRL